MAAEWYTFTTDKEWERYLRNLVRTNEVALKRAIICVYGNQTIEEQDNQTSIEYNSVGFNKWDAAYMSEIAHKLLAGVPLTQKELAISRNKMPKYWRQLMVVGQQKVERQAKRFPARHSAEEQNEHGDVQMRLPGF